MSRFAVIVTLKLKPGEGDAFREHILANATASKRDEPGCHRFDVAVSEDDGDAYYLYEEYTDAAAFEDHRQSPHYAAWREATDSMIAERSVVRCTAIG